MVNDDEFFYCLEHQTLTSTPCALPHWEQRAKKARDRALASLTEFANKYERARIAAIMLAPGWPSSFRSRRVPPQGPHPYTVDVILHGAEPYPCIICGKDRQAHD